MLLRSARRWARPACGQMPPPPALDWLCNHRSPTQANAYRERLANNKRNPQPCCEHHTRDHAVAPSGCEVHEPSCCDDRCNSKYTKETLRWGAGLAVSRAIDCAPALLLMERGAAHKQHASIERPNVLHKPKSSTIRHCEPRRFRPTLGGALHNMRRHMAHERCVTYRCVPLPRANLPPKGRTTHVRTTDQHCGQNAECNATRRAHKDYAPDALPPQQAHARPGDAKPLTPRHRAEPTVGARVYARHVKDRPLCERGPASSHVLTTMTDASRHSATTSKNGSQTNWLLTRVESKAGHIHAGCDKLDSGAANNGGDTCTNTKPPTQ